MSTRPLAKDLIGNKEAPMSLQRIMQSSEKGEMLWIGPDEAATLSKDELKATLAVAHRREPPCFSITQHFGADQILLVTSNQVP